MRLSYSQNLEDVMLWRALGHVANGHYIDIGAQDPVVDSVSLMFYEHGWRGTHIEPTPPYAEKLRAARPDETVIQAAVVANSGIVNFYEFPETGLSTGDPKIATRHVDSGFTVREIIVPGITLDELFSCVSHEEVHWLKIDVEGGEKDVLDGWANAACRPWIVVIESTLPLSQVESYVQWEPLILGKGYKFAYFDGLNRFYISNQHKELFSAFKSGPNAFDGFHLSGTSSSTFCSLLNDRIREQESLRIKELDSLKTVLDQVERNRAAEKRELNAKIDLNQAELLRLSQALAETEARCADRLQGLYAQMSATLTEANRHLLVSTQTLATREREFGSQLASLQGELSDAKQTLLDREQAWASSKQQHENDLSKLETRIEAYSDTERTLILSNQQQHTKIISLEHQLEGQVKNYNLMIQEWKTLQEGLLWRVIAAFRSLFGLRSGPAMSCYAGPAANKYVNLQNSTPDFNNLGMKSMSTGSVAKASSETIRVAKDLVELLNRHGATFIECAYLTLLQRQPDLSGERYYLSRLMEGTAKIQILMEMSESSEAALKGVVVPGLKEAIAQHKAGRRSLLKQIFVPLPKTEGDSPLEIRLRSMEQQMHLMADSFRGQLEQIESKFSGFLSAAVPPDPCQLGTDGQSVDKAGLERVLSELRKWPTRGRQGE